MLLITRECVMIQTKNVFFVITGFIAVFVVIVVCVMRKKKGREPNKDQTKQDTNIDKVTCMGKLM